MLTQPSRSAHSAMSRAAAYRSPHVVPAKDGLRKSNRSPKSKLTRAMLSGRGAESAEGAVVGADVDVAPRRALEVGADRARSAGVVRGQRQGGDGVPGVLQV